MNFNGTMTGCPTSNCPNSIPTTSNCCNVVQTCNVEEVPHYTNYHTHVVNNCIKRHINIPTYSTDAETVVINEYVNAEPIYYNNPGVAPNYNQYVNQGMPYQANQPYTGNVGTNPYQAPLGTSYPGVDNTTGSQVFGSNPFYR